jgi:hypothetical protein
VQKGLDKVVRVKLNPAGDGYVAVLSDGSDMAFSKNCLNGKQVDPARLHKGHVQEALRNEVLDQTRSVRFSAGYGGCGADMHVGHVGKCEFKALTVKFLETKNLSMADVCVVKLKQRGNHHYDCWYLADSTLSEQWKQFHHNHATMVMQTSGENLTRKRQKVA